jgi:hypothetical protein
MVWLVMKAAGALLTDQAPLNKEPFGLSVVIRIPRPAPPRHVNTAGIVKTLFDGIIASFHVYEGNHLAEICKRLGERLGRSPVEIAQYLTDDTGAALGKRRLVSLRADGIQWNPADDRCVAGELLIEAGDSPSFELSGQLFPVTQGNATGRS